MKQFSKLCATVVLITVFALFTHAGEMSTPGVIQQPPRDDSARTNVSDGEETFASMAKNVFDIIENALTLF